MKFSEFTKEDAQKLLLDYSLRCDFEIEKKITILGIRAANDRIGIYDDIIALVAADFFLAVPGNTDPSALKPGVAVLQPGLYSYKKGLHGVHHLNLTLNADKAIYDELISSGKDYPHSILDALGNPRILPYWAFRQAGPVLLHREGQLQAGLDNWPDKPAWIDIHKGGVNTTSSLGCQTIHPDHWEEFRREGYWLMEQYGQEVIQYCLVQAQN